jgi:hypothetical protein
MTTALHRTVCTCMQGTEAAVSHGLSEGQPLDQVVPCLEYLRDRVGVPRDMSFPAARYISIRFCCITTKYSAFMLVAASSCTQVYGYCLHAYAVWYCCSVLARVCTTYCTALCSSTIAILDSMCVLHATPLCKHLRVCSNTYQHFVCAHTCAGS